MKRLLLPLVTVVLAIALFTWLSSRRQPQGRGARGPVVRGVETSTAHPDTLTPRIRAYGRVTSPQTIAVVPEVSGVVERAPFALFKGRSFSGGEVLMRIDTRQAVLARNAAAAELLNILGGVLPELAVDFPSSRPAWDRFFDQIAQGELPPLPEGESSRERHVINRSGVPRLYYALAQSRLALEKHTIRAPFNGTVTASQIAPGAMARVAATAATIVRTDRAEIELALPPADARLLRTGAAAQVHPSPGGGGSRSATVDRISPVLDGSTQTVAVFVTFSPAADDGIVAGSYVAVTIPGTPLHHAFELPRQALLGDTAVYVIDNGRLQHLPVELLVTGIDHVIVGGGIAAGTVVVTEPLQDAVVGMEVRTHKAASQETLPRKGTGKGAGP